MPISDNDESLDVEMERFDPYELLCSPQEAMRQHMHRFTRLTAAHSKKLVNHIHMVSLYTVWYNYARINSAVRMAPAMAAGISDRLWDVADIVKLIEACENAETVKL